MLSSPIVRRLICCTLLALTVPAATKAQTYPLDLLEQGSYQWVEGDVRAVLPRHADSLAVWVYETNTDTDPTFELWLLARVPKYNHLRKLQVLDNLNAVPFNIAKWYTTLMSHDTLYLGSQMPFRATWVELAYRWNGQQFIYLDETITDPSAESVIAAEECLARRDVRCALDQYSQVMYPTSYFNPIEVFGELVVLADEAALALYQKKQYTEAFQLMDEALSFAWGYDLTATEGIQQLLHDGLPPRLSRRALLSALGNWGVYALLSNQLSVCIGVNQALTTLDPDTPGPYLQLADAYYLQSNPQHRDTYRRYIALMKQQSRERQIPQRAHQRAR